MPDIQDGFHRAIYQIVSAEIDSRMISLAKGSAIDYGDYQSQVGYLAALNDVLSRCEEIEKERYGDPLGKQEAE